MGTSTMLSQGRTLLCGSQLSAGEKVEQPIVTVDNLENLRSAVREILVNHSLDVLEVYPNFTLELSTLLTYPLRFVNYSVDPHRCRE